MARTGLIPDPCGVPASAALHWRLEDAGLEPSLDQAKHPGVGDPVRQHTHQPSVVDEIEEGADVDIEHKVHVLRHQGLVQSAQGRVRAPHRPEAVAEPQKVGLVDGIQHLGHRPLDDFVFQCRNAERAETAVSFRDVGSAHRLGPVLSAVDLACRRWRLASKLPPVVLHRHPIDARTGRASLPPERPFERSDIDVMQQRREPRLARTSVRLVHTREVRLQGCQRRVWPFACPVVILFCRFLFSIASFPSATSSIVWSGPTSHRDAADDGCPSFATPTGDCWWTLMGLIGSGMGLSAVTWSKPPAEHRVSRMTTRDVWLSLVRSRALPPQHADFGNGCHTPSNCCLLFVPRVAATPATLAPVLPARL